MKIVKSAALLLVIILMFSFSVFNMHPVKVSFYAWESPELPLFLMLIFAFALGVAAAALWGALRAVGRSKPAKTKAPHKKKRDDTRSGGREERTVHEDESPQNSDESK
ncbi:MAG: DUF1049 domain-containing protein [Desulfuromonadales bacterium]|nr:DUF1049 domain-containing protein [Desulfuromonadales bacterium]